MISIKVAVMKRLIKTLIVLAAILSAAQTCSIADESDRQVQALIGALSVEDPKVRNVVIEALGKSGKAAAVAPLVDICENGVNIEVRRVAYQALAKLGQADALDTLAGAMRDDDKEIYRAGIAGILAIKDPKTIPLLAEILDYPSPKTAEKAEQMLAGFGDKSLGVLTTCLAGDLPARKHAARALVRIGSPDALKALAAWANGNDLRNKLIVVSQCVLLLPSPAMHNTASNVLMGQYSVDAEKRLRTVIINGLYSRPIAYNLKRDHKGPKYVYNTNVPKFLCMVAVLLPHELQNNHY